MEQLEAESWSQQFWYSGGSGGIICLEKHMEAGSNPVRMGSHWNEEVTFLLITEECDTLVWFLVTFCIDTLRIPKEVQKKP